MYRTRLALGSALLLIALAGAGCQPVAPAASTAVPAADTPATEVPATEAPAADAPAQAGAVDFTTVAQGDSMVADVEAPTLFLIEDSSDLDALAARLGEPEQAAQLQQMDLATGLGLAAFAGMKGSSGHSITIQSIEAGGDALTVVVDVRAPDPGQMNADVISYPFHVVQVQRTDLGSNAPVKWQMVDTAGALLAEGS